MNQVQITGYVIEVGDMGMGRRNPEGPEDRGVEMECEKRYVKVKGLTKGECKFLAEHLNEKATITITVDGEVKS